MIKAILFDLDGTLADTNNLIFQSFRHTLAHYDILDVSDEDIYALFGEPLEYSMARFKPEEVDNMVTVYRNYNESRHDELIRPFANVQETLAELKERGLALAIVTSKRQAVAMRSLDALDLTPYFDVIVTPELTQKHKPDPAPVNYALNALGVSPNEAVMVGDSPFDIASGKGAGCQTVAVTYSKITPRLLAEAQPTLMIDSISDLLNYVKEEEN